MFVAQLTARASPRALDPFVAIQNQLNLIYHEEEGGSSQYIDPQGVGMDAVDLAHGAHRNRSRDSTTPPPGPDRPVHQPCTGRDRLDASMRSRTSPPTGIPSAPVHAGLATSPSRAYDRRRSSGATNIATWTTAQPAKALRLHRRRVEERLGPIHRHRCSATSRPRPSASVDLSRHRDDDQVLSGARLDASASGCPRCSHHSAPPPPGPRPTVITSLRAPVVDLVDEARIGRLIYPSGLDGLQRHQAARPAAERLDAFVLQINDRRDKPVGISAFTFTTRASPASSCR